MISIYKRLIVTAAICITGTMLLSCKKSHISVNIQRPVFTDSVYIESISFDSEAIVMPPNQIELIDSMLLFYRPGIAAVKTFSTKTGEELPLSLNIGRGPGEFIQPWAAGSNTRDSLFYIYDMDNSFSAFKLRTLNNGELGFDFISKESIARPEDQIISRGMVLNDQQLLFQSPFKSDSILLIMNKNTGSFRKFCNPMPTNAENLTYLSGHAGCYNDKIFFASIKIGYIVCYSFDEDNNVRKEWEYMMADPVALPQSPFKLDWEKNPNGFYDLKVTDNYVFVAYSGNTSETGNPSSRKHLAETILVFDHSGVPVRKIKLDKKIGRFAVTPDNSSIYSFYSTTSNIIKYDLSGMLQ